MSNYAAPDRPLFIIGNPRSGTSLLRLMLTAHSRIVIAPECGFAIWYLEKYGDWSSRDLATSRRTTFLDDLWRAKKLETWNLTRPALERFIVEEAPETYSSLVAAVYRFFATTTKPAFRLWGDKNNHYLHHIATIRSLFPGARFVHIVRDGRTVACSYKALAQRKIISEYAPRLPADIKEIATEWSGNTACVRSAFDSFQYENAIELRFEDLVSRPVQSLQSICNFLDLRYEPQMLEYYRLTPEEAAEPSCYQEWKSKTRSALLVDEVDRYSRELSQEELELFSSLAGTQLSWYGYY